MLGVFMARNPSPKCLINTYTHTRNIAPIMACLISIVVTNTFSILPIHSIALTHLLIHHLLTIIS